MRETDVDTRTFKQIDADDIGEVVINDKLSVDLVPAVTLWLTQRQVELLTIAAKGWGCDSIEVYMNQFWHSHTQMRNEHVDRMFTQEMMRQAGEHSKRIHSYKE